MKRGIIKNRIGGFTHGFKTEDGAIHFIEVQGTSYAVKAKDYDELVDTSYGVVRFECKKIREAAIGEIDMGLSEETARQLLGRINA